MIKRTVFLYSSVITRNCFRGVWRGINLSHLIKLLSLILVISISKPTFAESLTVPLFLNYSSLLYDDGGNLLPTGPVGITFKITDEAGIVFFEEYQSVDVLNGAVSAIVGNGLNSYNAPSGGVPVDVFTPDGSRFLEVTVDNYPMEGPMEIVSVPYSIYAQKAFSVADESIGGAQIAEHVITKNHLTDELLTDLATELGGGSSIATVTDLDTMESLFRSTTGAQNIGVAPPFIYSSGVNVQEVLTDLDRAIQMRQVNIDNVVSSVGDLTDTMATQASLDIVSASLLTHETSADAHGVTGSIVGETDSQTLTNKTLGSGTVISSNVTVNPGVTIDGVDISALGGTDFATQAELDSHAGSTGTHGVSGAIVGTTSAQTLTNKTLTSPTVNGGTLSGTRAGGYNIGDTLDNHEGRITVLEAKDVNDPQVVRWGSIGLTMIVVNGHAVQAPDVLFGNVTAEPIFVSNVQMSVSRIIFNNSLSDANYVVQITPWSQVATRNPILITNRTANGFDVSHSDPIVASIDAPSNFDFTVVK